MGQVLRVKRGQRERPRTHSFPPCCPARKGLHWKHSDQNLRQVSARALAPGWVKKEEAGGGAQERRMEQDDSQLRVQRKRPAECLRAGVHVYTQRKTDWRSDRGKWRARDGARLARQRKACHRARPLPQGKRKSKNPASSARATAPSLFALCSSAKNGFALQAHPRHTRACLSGWGTLTLTGDAGMVCNGAHGGRECLPTLSTES